AAIKDVGRVLGYPYQEVDKIAKLVPSPILGKYSPLIESLENDPDLRKTYESDPRAKVLLNYAKKIEGTVRQIGTHACAVVISEKPLTEYTALQMSASGKDEIVTQYSAKPIENLGLLKMDFLGLRNLTVIQKTKEFVLERTGEKVVMDEISLEDKDTFDLLQKGDTTGVFQLESAGMRRYLKDLKPTKFEDIVAMGALYRPGPMEWIPDYIKGKHNPEKVHYMHPSFKSVLESTYGVAVYQEQILQLARDFAGFTFGEADILRKAVGKKSTSLLMEQREKFTQGAVKNGYNEKLAKDVFEHVIEPFAGYGFNRAHAVCYGLIAYETAYLKAHYPIEFMTALLCSDPGNTDRVVLEIKECNEMGINVLPPSVNESFAHFAVDEKNQIRFGMLAIKGIGDGPVKEIIEAREKGGKFKNLVDFTKRVSAHVFNKKLIESLALSGAMDEFGDRKQIAENYEEISKYAKAAQQISSGNQTNIFGMMDASEQIEPEITMKSVPKSTSFECLKWEKQLLGMYVSGHPLRGLKKYLAKKAHLIGEITPKQLKNKVIVIGLISGIRKILTKGGTYMATFVIEDSTGKINAIIFPKTLSGYGQFLSEDGILEISGALDFRQGQYQISCDCIKVLSLEAMIKNAKSSKVFDADDKSGLGVRFLDDILSDKEIKNEVDSAKIEDFSLDDVKPAKIPIENKIYLIKIENQADKDMLGNLKNLLFDHKGDTPVEILLNVAKKRIKLPFGINLTPDLQKRVESLLTSEK
ncbi:DNA polymerase III subunit alpha, partial [Candidatus Peregrinibacteria bacterium]|nr:DNA polymerase III subunit alpha [Candidatus Peregrinibacteria bacterium]